MWGQSFRSVPKVHRFGGYFMAVDSSVYGIKGKTTHGPREIASNVRLTLPPIWVSTSFLLDPDNLLNSLDLYYKLASAGAQSITSGERNPLVAPSETNQFTDGGLSCSLAYS
jgi:hypothetical protein